MKRILFLLLFLLRLTFVSCVESIRIDNNNSGRVCEGWGVSLCWWAAQCGQWSEEQLDSLVDWLVSPDGLNYNVFRYNIGGGDDPMWTNCQPHHFGNPGGKGLRAEIEGFRDATDAPYQWQRDETQRRIMLLIKRKRPDAVFEAFSNSAPWWMTASGCCAGADRADEDNVLPEQYEAFARYLVDVCLFYKQQYGIEFHSLDPFNEPMTDYWYRNGGQEGCHFSVEGQIAFLRILAPMLQASGLSTIISAPDETSVEQALADLRAYADAGVLSWVGQWNTHTYQGTNTAKQQLRQLCDSLGILLWQSETGDGGNGLHGNVRMAQRLVDDIRYLQPAVWCDWQYVEENYDQWSLVMCDRQWGTYRRHANYYVRQQFSRFIPVGYRWLSVNDSHGIAAQSPDGHTLVYVTLNPAKHAERTLDVQVPDGFHLSEAYRTSKDEQCQRVSLSLNLPPTSVLTLIYRR